MTDLTFNNLATHPTAPANVFVVTNNKLMLDIGTLIGETVDSLSDTQVTECCYKLLKLASNAQAKYNTDNNLTFGSRITAFSVPSYGTPQEQTTGVITTDASLTVTARLAVDSDEVTSPIG